MGNGVRQLSPPRPVRLNRILEMTNGPIKKSSSHKFLDAANKKNKNATTVMKQKRKAAKIAKEAGHSTAISAASAEFFGGKTPRSKKLRKKAKDLFSASKALKKSARSPK